MSSKPWSGKSIAQRVEDILEAIKAIREYTENMTAESFFKDRRTQSAVERELLIVSEACSKIRDMQEREGIPHEKRVETYYEKWHAICGIGNLLRHEYGRVDKTTLWNTVSESDDLGELELVIRNSFDLL